MEAKATPAGTGAGKSRASPKKDDPQPAGAKPGAKDDRQAGGAKVGAKADAGESLEQAIESLGDGAKKGRRDRSPVQLTFTLDADKSTRSYTVKSDSMLGEGKSERMGRVVNAPGGGLVFQSRIVFGATPVFLSAAELEGLSEGLFALRSSPRIERLSVTVRGR